MSAAQGWLIVGALLHFLIAALAGYVLFWVRARDPAAPVGPYGIIAHRAALLNGFLLIGLAVAVDHSGFSPGMSLGLAAAEIVATLSSDLRNLMNWRGGLTDAIAQSSMAGLRLRGLMNAVHIVVISALLYGVSRTVLGL